jgi:glycosyltransferase involved in cell wall biosynthesis
LETLAEGVHLHIRIDGTSIKPGQSAGVEAFTYGLVQGLADATDYRIEVEILDDTLDAWRAQVTKDEIVWSETTMALRSDTPLGDRLRRFVPTQVRESRVARRAVNSVRGRTRSVTGGADVTLYPFSCVPITAGSSVLVLHDLRRFQPGFRRSGYNDIISENVAKAAAVAVSWPHPYQQVREIFPEAHGKTVMIPLPTFHARPGNQVNLPEDGLLVYPSSTAPHKNHATLLAAMALVPEMRLVCPGPLVEPQATELAGRAAEPDLSGRVSFPGFISAAELTALYRRAWAVVVPSTWEAASGAIFEAFSWGLPVACADVPPLRAQVEFAGGDAVFFDPLDADALASAVRRLGAERGHYAAASRAASDRLAGRTWSDTAMDYAAVFDWVAQGRVGPIPQSGFGVSQT